MQQILRELQSRASKGLAARALLDDLHPGQRRFLFARDGAELARFVCLLSARRFGKTEGFLRYGCSLCLSRPRRRVIVVYQHRVDAKDIAWPILEDLQEQYGFRARPYRVELAYRFPNNSVLKLYGADDPRKHRQFKGQRNDLFVIDEVQDFYSDVERIVRWVSPGLADRRGRLLLTGTPPDREHGYYFEVLTGRHPEWIVVQGHPHENPHTRAELLEQEAIYRRANPNIEQEPWFRREHRGELVVDTRNTVCHLDPALNYLHEWQPHESDRYLLSIDWGDTGAAFSVSTWNTDKHPWLIFLESHEAVGLKISDHVAMIQGLQRKYDNRLQIVADPGGVAKAIVRELTEVHGIAVLQADKENRAATIELMNTDLSLGLVKIYNRDDPAHPEEHPLAKQWNTLTWVRNRHGEKEEGTPRHVHDTALYARRFAYKHLHQPAAAPPPVAGTPEYWAAEEQRLFAEAQRRQEERLMGPWHRRRGGIDVRPLLVRGGRG